LTGWNHELRRFWRGQDCFAELAKKSSLLMEEVRLQTPFDDFCLKSNILCKSCDRKIRSGEYSKIDLEISRFLLDQTQDIHQLANLTFRRSILEGEYLILILGKGHSNNFLVHGRKLIKDLSKKYGKRVKVLEENQSTREILESLFTPAKILALNTIWLPDGTTETKVILGKHVRWQKSEIDSLKKLAKMIKGVDIRVEFV
jgi:transcription antitermination factor NusA-like protein